MVSSAHEETCISMDRKKIYARIQPLDQMKGIHVTCFLLFIGVIENATLNCAEVSWSYIDPQKLMHGKCQLEDNMYSPDSRLSLFIHGYENPVHYDLTPHTVFNLYHPFQSRFGVQDLVSFPNSDIAYHAMTYYIERRNGHSTICTPLDCITLKRPQPFYLELMPLDNQANCLQFMEIGPRLVEQQKTFHLGFCIHQTLPPTRHYTPLYPNKDQHSLFYITNSTPTGFSIIDHSNLPPVSINKSINSIPIIPSSLINTSHTTSFALPEHTIEVRDFSSSINNHPFFAVTGSFSPLIERPDRLFLIKTPRRIYSIVKEGEDKVSLREDTGRDDLKSVSKDEDKSSFLLIQTFPHKLLVREGTPEPFRFSAMPLHRHGYEKRRAKGIVTGVRALQHFLNSVLLLDKLLKKEKPSYEKKMFSVMADNSKKGESYLFSFLAALRTITTDEQYKKALQFFKSSGVRDWERERSSEVNGEMVKDTDWEGRAYWVDATESLVLKDLVKEFEDEEKRKRSVLIVISLASLAAFSVGAFFFKHIRKNKKEKLLPDTSSPLA